MSRTTDTASQPPEVDVVSDNQAASPSPDDANWETNGAPRKLDITSSSTTEMPPAEYNDGGNEAANRAVTREYDAAVLLAGEARAESSKSDEHKSAQLTDPATMSSPVPEPSEKIAETETDSTGSEPCESSNTSTSGELSPPLSQATLEANSFSTLFDRILQEVSLLSREERLALMPWIPKGAEPVGVDHETAMGWIDEITEEHIRSLEEDDGNQGEEQLHGKLRLYDVSVPDISQ